MSNTQSRTRLTPIISLELDRKCEVPKSVFYSMRKDEGRTLFNQMEERKMHKECFGI